MFLAARLYEIHTPLLTLYYFESIVEGGPSYSSSQGVGVSSFSKGFTER